MFELGGFPVYVRDYLTEARMMMVVGSPRSNVIITGITDGGVVSEPWRRFFTRFSVGQREIQRDRKIQARKAEVIWRSS